MKLKIIVKVIEKMFGIASDENQPRADLYLPDRLLAMSLGFLIAGISGAVYAVFRFSALVIVFALLCVVLGFFAFLCWKNQTIKMISDDQFTYTTMFGNSHTYSFSEIHMARRNQDSTTIFVANKKVHIESMAIISDRLVKRINRALSLDEKYVKMNTDELSQLSDDELYQALWNRLEWIVSEQEDLSVGFQSLNEEQRIFYAVNYLEMEVNNGGLCQFFVNSSRVIAPIVSEYMGQIGAEDHKSLYDTFLEKHHINPYYLSSFDCDTVDDFKKQYERYPFAEYDNAFYELEPMQQRLISFAKEHIDRF